MPTAKKTTPTAASKKASTAAAPATKKAAKTAVAATKKTAVKASTSTPVPKAAPSAKPIKETFTKAALAAHLAEVAAVDRKAVLAVLAALEDVVLRSVHKKGVGEFALLGLVKIDVQAVPAKKKRFAKDPFTGEDRWFAAKPASVRIKARPLKKLKDAAA